jgi:hypothetical protein
MTAHRLLVRTALATAVALLLLALLLPHAGAAGGPVAGADAGGSGVVVPGDDTSRIVTVWAGRGTVVQRIARDGGTVERWRYLKTPFIVAAAAADLTGTGLSADGRTLVLTKQRYRFPIRRSEFLVLDGRSLKPRTTLRLRGDFTLDAISPDGKLLYLVEYTSPKDITKYEVRAYDMAARQLMPDPVVARDAAGEGEEMAGSPLARTMSPDGRWAYTLYDGNGSHPFVHALDTQQAKAVCVDLDDLAGRDDLWSMRLTTGPGGDVVVNADSGPLLRIDPKSFAVGPAIEPARAAAPAPARRSAPAAASADDGVPISAVLAGGVIVLLLAGGATAALVRRGRAGRLAVR